MSPRWRHTTKGEQIKGGEKHGLAVLLRLLFEWRIRGALLLDGSLSTSDMVFLPQL